MLLRAPAGARLLLHSLPRYLCSADGGRASSGARIKAKAQASRRAAFPGRSPPADADGPVAVAVVQPGGSAGAKLVVEHDGAAGGVVRDVRAHRLALGGSHRCTARGRIVEVGLEHAEIR